MRSYRGRYARHLLESLEHGAVEDLHRVSRSIRRTRKVDRHRREPRRPKAELDAPHPEEALHHEPRAGKEHERVYFGACRKVTMENARQNGLGSFGRIDQPGEWKRPFDLSHQPSARWLRCLNAVP